MDRTLYKTYRLTKAVAFIDFYNVAVYHVTDCRTFDKNSDTLVSSHTASLNGHIFYFKNYVIIFREHKNPVSPFFFAA